MSDSLIEVDQERGVLLPPRRFRHVTRPAQRPRDPVNSDIPTRCGV